jgi:nucleoside-diphosphate-sugar epimerase
MTRITDEELEDRLSEPTTAVVDCLRKCEGDLIVLGAGGKMGPSLCHMARRATDMAGGRRRVVAVSRFSDANAAAQLERWGIDIIRGDLLDRAFVGTLPRCPLVVSMSGQKFGTSGAAARTWATNAYLPAIVCEHFSASRIVAFSSGNVYGLVSVGQGSGSIETDTLRPVGEYAMSAVGRERMYEHFSRENGTPISIIRLNYAVELRYGVLVDLARKVFEREAVNVEMGYANVIWQADASAMALASLALAASPPFVLNVAGPELLRCRDVATRFGELFGLPVAIEGTEAPSALLNDAAQALRLFGQPRVPVDVLMPWIAEWIKERGTHWGKPTHYESRDGQF